MTGLIQDPKISFNFKRAKKNINQRLQQQKKKLMMLSSKSLTRKKIVILI